eukprot:scaffold7704_cov112-Isochrysis_galbana.AAC.3
MTRCAPAAAAPAAARADSTPPGMRPRRCCSRGNREVPRGHRLGLLGLSNGRGHHRPTDMLERGIMSSPVIFPRGAWPPTTAASD